MGIPTVFDYFPPLNYIVKWCLLPFLKNKGQKHADRSKRVIDQRIAQEIGRPDFMRYILETNRKGGMTIEEIYCAVSLVVPAGSESSATTLTSATWFSLKSPYVAQRL